MRIILLSVLCLFSTAVFADAKSDYFSAIQACVAANPPAADGTVTDARIACDFAAMIAYQMAIAPASTLAKFKVSKPKK